MLELKSVLEEWRAVPESLEGGWGDDDLFMSGACCSISYVPILRALILRTTTRFGSAWRQAQQDPTDEVNATPSPI